MPPGRAGEPGREARGPAPGGPSIVSRPGTVLLARTAVFSDFSECTGAFLRRIAGESDGT
jgi:hypothetical protein